MAARSARQYSTGRYPQDSHPLAFGPASVVSRRRLPAWLRALGLPGILAIAISLLGLSLRIEHALTFDGPKRGADYSAFMSGVAWIREHKERFDFNKGVNSQVQYSPPLWFAAAAVLQSLTGKERSIAGLAVVGWAVRQILLALMLRRIIPQRRWSILAALAINAVLPVSVLTDGKVNPEGLHTTLFTVANLSRVWVMADLYEMDLGRIHVGDPAVFVTEGIPGRTFRSRVEFVYPTVSTETRTVKLRLALDNPTGALRPGMYGRVTLRARPSAAMAVPVESVVRTGDETYVFVARAGGRFEPRRVVTGSQDGEWTQILSGLAVGDTVVASASFLIDSESRLKAAIGGMGSHP